MVMNEYHEPAMAAGHQGIQRSFIFAAFACRTEGRMSGLLHAAGTMLMLLSIDECLDLLVT
jgi:hypothetical protein